MLYLVRITERGYQVTRRFSGALEKAMAEAIEERESKPWLGPIVLRDGQTGRRYSLTEMKERAGQ